MKKYLKSMFMLGLVLGILFNSYSILAKKVNPSQAHLIPIKNNSVTEEKVSDDLVKKETITYFKYNYGDKCGENRYEYVSVRVTINYYNSDGKDIASAYFESNFRYNTALKLVKCLSTSHGQSCSNNKYSIDLSCRTKNLSISIGESFGKVTLKKMLLPKDKSIYIFSCDTEGNVYRRTF